MRGQWYAIGKYDPTSVAELFKHQHPRKQNVKAQGSNYLIVQAGDLPTELTSSHYSSLRASSDRLWHDIHSTAKYGIGERYGNHPHQTGLSRLTLTEHDKQARDWFAKTARSLGCTVEIDSIGNVFAIRPGLNNNVPATFVGSHLDSQPTGGRFDGVLGVCAGIEMLRVLNDNWIETEGPVGVVNWTNEEGARFPVSMMGSGVWSGTISQEEVSHLKEVNVLPGQQEKKTLEEELNNIQYLGANPAPLNQGGIPMAGHFELHIEQGPRLITSGQQIAAVNGVQAYKWFNVKLTGRACHTGTTPFQYRIDPLLSAAKIIAQVHNTATKHNGLASVGIINAEPGSINTVPSQVSFSLDIRHETDAGLDQLIAEIRRDFWNEQYLAQRGRRTATTLQYDITEIFSSPAAHFDEVAVSIVEESAKDITGDSNIQRMISGAGHDSVNTSKQCSTAMVFVPCKDGISHHPAEWAEQEDCAAGTDVIIHSVLKFDKMRYERGDFDSAEHAVMKKIMSAVKLPRTGSIGDQEVRTPLTKGHYLPYVHSGKLNVLKDSDYVDLTHPQLNDILTKHIAETTNVTITDEPTTTKGHEMEVPIKVSHRETMQEQKEETLSKDLKLPMDADKMKEDSRKGFKLNTNTSSASNNEEPVLVEGSDKTDGSSILCLDHEFSDTFKIWNRPTTHWDAFNLAKIREACEQQGIDLTGVETRHGLIDKLSRHKSVRTPQKQVGGKQESQLDGRGTGGKENRDAASTQSLRAAPGVPGESGAPINLPVEQEAINKHIRKIQRSMEELKNEQLLPKYWITWVIAVIHKRISQVRSLLHHRTKEKFVASRSVPTTALGQPSRIQDTRANDLTSLFQTTSNVVEDYLNQVEKVAFQHSTFPLEKALSLDLSGAGDDLARAIVSIRDLVYELVYEAESHFIRNISSDLPAYKYLSWASLDEHLEHLLSLRELYDDDFKLRGCPELEQLFQEFIDEIRTTIQDKELLINWFEHKAELESAMQKGVDVQGVLTRVTGMLGRWKGDLDAELVQDMLAMVEEMEKRSVRHRRSNSNSN
ncbi:hypothetical protein LTS08_007755 [Lithohypha guttulata]|nr:hypothetical protein LTS08_007755 [Lithohypha guttulata]